MNKWVKRIGIICLLPIIIALILSILLYIPAFQNFAVQKATQIASESTGMKINIERINLSFPIKLNIHGIEVIKDTIPADTLFSLNNLNIAIRPIPLLKKDILVESIGLKDLKINTGDLIDGIEIKGGIGNCIAKADRISLAKEKATFNNLEIADATVTLLLTESTTPEDTTQSAPINWLIDLEKINLKHVALALQMPEDSLRLSGYVTEAGLRNGEVDLGRGCYKADNFKYKGSFLNYDANEQPALNGLDPSHIYLSDIDIILKSLLYSEESIKADINKFIAKERSGIEIKKFKGEFNGDNQGIKLPELVLETAYSEARLKGSIPYSAFSNKPKGKMDVDFHASFGKKDIIALAGNLSEDAIQAYPDTSLRIQAKAKGSLKSLELDKLDAQLPGAFVIRTTGKGESLQSNKKRRGELNLNLFTEDLDFLLGFFEPESRNSIRIPKKMMLTGDVQVQDQFYKGDLEFREGSGKICLNTTYNQIDSTFFGYFEIDSIEPNHFIHNDSLTWLNAFIKAEGKGSNLFDSLTWAKMDGKIKDIQYGKSSISDIALNGTLKKNFIKLNLISNYPLAVMDMTLNANLQKDYINTMLIADMKHIDLAGFHLSNKPFSTSFEIFAEAETDLKDFYKADLTLGNWILASGKHKVDPKPIIMKALAQKDTTYLALNSGDFKLKIESDKGINGLSHQFNLISQEMSRQMKKDSIIRLNELKPHFPNLDMEIKAKKDNPIFHMFNIFGVSFQGLALNANTSPEKGIQMNGSVYRILRDTFLLDTLKMNLWQDSLGIYYEAGVVKKKFKRQSPFTAKLNGKLMTGYTDATLQFKNRYGKTGILLGASLEKKEKSDYVLHFFPENPIFAFDTLQLNKDNYIRLRNEKEIFANFLLKGSSNTFLEIKTDSIDAGFGEVRAALGEVNLKEMSEGFSDYMPSLDGILSLDFQYLPTDTSFTMTAGASIDSLCYEGKRVGDLLMSMVYLPVSEKEHQFDMHLFHDDKEFMNSFVYYQSGLRDSIDGELYITDLPLEMMNPFMPEDMARLNGKMQGELTIDGTSSLPILNGFAYLDSANMFITAANTNIKLDTAKVRVTTDKIIFDQYKLLANGKNPFIIDGYVNFSDPSNMTANLKLNANNMLLLDAKRSKESLIYGKMLVNMNSTIKGPLNSLVMRGNVHLLGGTNVTYILKDSPLTVQDRLSGLVTFTSFEEDTILNRRKKAAALPIGGLDMLMTIHIDQAVQANVDLTPDQSNRINLEGGGDLTFQYTPMGDMVLSGRYTLTDGIIKYSLPLIPSKDFNVENGSYVQWNGDPFDPTMNITATERVRTSVSLGNKSSRMVNFDVGIQLTQQLENLGIKFVLEAPEDANVQEELARMGEEERAKQAVSMLVTGMFLGGGSTTGKANLNMGTALNTFLQNEINNIAGSALKTVDINFGMESYDEDGDGSKRTDYSFRFAKRFYNDRIRIVLGGRISTGDDINRGQAQPFIDNIAVEYRLDASGTRYIKLFHNKDYESLLEGELIETGVGIVLHKKMEHMRELFIFKKNKQNPQPEKEKKKIKEKKKNKKEKKENEN